MARLSGADAAAPWISMGRPLPNRVLAANLPGHLPQKTEPPGESASSTQGGTLDFFGFTSQQPVTSVSVSFLPESAQFGALDNFTFGTALPPTVPETLQLRAAGQRPAVCGCGASAWDAAALRSQNGTGS